MWIDDEAVRDPKDNTHPWVIVRSYDQAIRYFELFGIPNYIDFDHDLGDPDDRKSGMGIAKWIVNYDLDNNMNAIPGDFTFGVHSRNPNGADNIEGLLDNYLNERRERKKNSKNPT